MHDINNITSCYLIYLLMHWLWATYIFLGFLPIVFFRLFALQLKLLLIYKLLSLINVFKSSKLIEYAINKGGKISQWAVTFKFLSENWNLLKKLFQFVIILNLCAIYDLLYE